MRLPEGWEKTKIGAIAIKIGSGTTPKGGREVYQKYGIPIIRSQNVLWGKLDITDVAKIPLAQHKRMSNSVVLSNDILLNITGASIGRCCVVPPETGDANVNQHVCIIRVSKKAASEYVVNYLLSHNGQRQIELFQAGGNRQGLNFQQIGTIALNLPPLPEQKAIAGLLSTWDEAIGKTERLIVAKERAYTILLDKLVYRDRKSNWSEIQLGKVFKERTETKRFDLPLLSISRGLGITPREESNRKDSSNEDKSKYLRICPGDIGYNTMRMWQGVSALSELEGIVSPAYTICTPNSEYIDGLFASYLFKHPWVIHQFYKHSQGLTSDTWNLKFHHFAEIKLWIPPLNKQKVIAEELQLSGVEIKILKKQCEAIKKQKRGLMQKLLTGEWRVKIKDPHS